VAAARAYDAAVWRLRPGEAPAWANFPDTCPPDVAAALAARSAVREEGCLGAAGGGRGGGGGGGGHDKGQEGGWVSA
jgi:hypothetical protein